MRFTEYSIICLLLVESTSSLDLIHNLQCDPCTCTSSNVRRFNGYSFQTDADCSGRGLTTIPDRIPDGIEELKLDHNRITPEGLSEIKRFKKLKRLSLAYNHLQTLPDGLFQGTNFLQKLDMEGNVIDSLNETTFRSLQRLEEINGLEINTSPRSLFENLTNLAYLDIKFHQEEIPEDIFETLMLQKLRLSLVNARNIPENIFHFGPKSLRTITIEGPKVVDVSETLFDNLEVLNELDLKMSRLQSLPERLFGTAVDTSGKAVNLVKIQIEGVLALPSHLFQSQQSLSKVILRKLKYLPQKLFNQLETIRELEYSTSSIYNLPNGYFASLKGLQYLNLSHNDIEYLNEDVFMNLKSLYVLDLSHNKIRKLPDKLLRNLGMLNYLNLGNNELAKISNEVFKFKYTIGRLDLSNNFISIIDDAAFNDLLGLHELTLAKNEIEHLTENILEKSQHIKILNLSKNAVTDLPDKLLVTFDDLEVLDISHNKIKYMPIDFFPHLGDLLMVDLTGNSFECNCDFLIVVHTLILLRIRLNGDICTTPQSYAQRPARDIPLADICGWHTAFNFYLKYGLDPTSIVGNLESSFSDSAFVGESMHVTPMLTPYNSEFVEKQTQKYSVSMTILHTDSTEEGPSVSKPVTRSDQIEDTINLYDTKTHSLSTDFSAKTHTVAHSRDIGSPHPTSSAYSQTPHLPSIDSHSVEVLPKVSISRLSDIEDESTRRKHVEGTDFDIVSQVSSTPAIISSLVIVSSETKSVDKQLNSMPETQTESPGKQIIPSINFETSINTLPSKTAGKKSDFLFPDRTEYPFEDTLGTDFNLPDPGKEKAPEVNVPTVETSEFQIPIGIFAALTVMAFIMAGVMKLRIWYRARTYKVNG